MKILITGGAGFIGSNAAEFFAARNEDVIVFDNLMRSKFFNYETKCVEYNWNYLKKYNNIKRVLGDVRNTNALKKVITKDLDVIIHTAAQPGIRYSITNPIEDYTINAVGTLNVLDAIRDICPDTAFIYCSTNKVYGERINSLLMRELDKRYAFRNVNSISENFGIDMARHTPYGASKLAGDLYAQEYGYTYGIKTGVFRMSCIYGTRQFGLEDQGWIAHFIISAILNKPVTIYGNGKQVRDALYVEDLIRAFDLFIKSNLKTEVFNIGGGKDNTISLLEFIEIIKAKTGNAMAVNFADWRPFDQKVYISDISKVQKTLNWTPFVKLKEGIDKVIAWVNENISYFR